MLRWAVGGRFHPPARMPLAVVMGENGQLGTAGECFRAREPLGSA